LWTRRYALVHPRQEFFEILTVTSAPIIRTARELLAEKICREKRVELSPLKAFKSV